MFKFSKLREYQLEDAKFLASLEAGGCFNEQRTGKTPTSLAACALKGCKRIVIICPAIALYPWLDAYEEWMGEPCVVCEGTPKKRKQILQQFQHGIIMSYDTLKITERTAGHIKDILDLNPDALLLDEAHRINSPKTATTQAAFSLIKIPYRLLLTGTPIRSKQEGIWSLLHMINPKQWPAYWTFIKEYFMTAVRTNKQGTDYVDIMAMFPKKEHELQVELSKVSTMRKRKDVMPWLPEREPPILIRLPATDKQQKYLRELEQYYETEHVITKSILDRLIRYRQICLAPELLGLSGTSPKIDWIDSYIKDYPDVPTIFFSKFTSFINLIVPRYKNVGVITGATPAKDRQEYVKAFQRGKINQLFINIDAGKESLTLDRAEAIVFTDKYPPIADIEQAEDRFVATTSDKAHIPKRIYELMMKDTYDEAIFKLLKLRKSEADIINNYKEHLERRNNADHS